MKKILLILILGCILSCKEKASNSRTNDKEKSLAAFNVLLMDSTKFSTINISKGRPIVLFFFGPNCPYCQKLSKDIVAHMDKFENVQIFFLSPEPFHEIKNYNVLFKLSKHPNVTVGQDYTGIFFSYFKGANIPYLVIYDKEKRYKQTIVGNVGVDSIVNVVNG